MIKTQAVADHPDDWQSIVKNLQAEAFPSPWRSDDCTAGNNPFLQVIKSAIQKEDIMRFEKKNNIPYLVYGSHDNVMGQGIPDYSNCKNAVIHKNPDNVDTVIEDLLSHFFANMNNITHPMFMPNVIPPISTTSLAAVLIGSKVNPNMLNEHGSLNAAKAELEVASMIISTLPTGVSDGEWPAPWSPQAPNVAHYYEVLAVPKPGEGSGGITTFGGTGCYLYAIKYALTKTANSVLENGETIRATGFDKSKFVIVVSKQGHYCISNVTDWCGIGYENVVTVQTGKDNTMDLEDLRKKLNYCKDNGKVVAAVVATFGTTDAGALDDVAGIRVVIRNFDNIVDPVSGNRYRKPLLYADSVTGWLWVFWRGYDFKRNPLNFAPTFLRWAKANANRATGLADADAFGTDFHKTGYSAYPASMILFKDYGEFATLMKRDPPSYLQQEQYDPALYTLETSRGCTGAVSAWAALRHLGQFGICSLTYNLLEKQNYLREQLIATGVAVICNESNHFYTTLLRIYPCPHTRDDYERELTEEEDYLHFKAINEFQKSIYNILYKNLRKNDGSAYKLSTPNVSLTAGFRYTYYNAEGDKCETNSTDPMQGVFALKCYFNNPYIQHEHVDKIIKHILVARLDIILFYLKKYVRADLEQLPTTIVREIRKDIHPHHNLIPAKLIPAHYLWPKDFDINQDPELVGLLKKLRQERRTLIDEIMEVKKTEDTPAQDNSA